MMKKIFSVMLLCATILMASCQKDDEATIGVSEVKLDQTELSLVVNTGGTLLATILPDNAEDATVTWSSSDKTVATVSEAGVVLAIKVGETTITATAGGKTATCKVTVTAKVVAVTGVTLTKQTTSIEQEKTEKLAFTIAPENATNQAVTWSSDKETIATVAQDGTVTAVAVGEANITVTTTDGSKTATCKVTVTAKAIAVTGVTLNKTTTTIEKEKTEKLVPTIAPANATDQTVTWSSDKETVATVSQDGTVTAVAKGETTITATSTSNPTVTATCKVKVEEKPSITWAAGNLVADGANGAKIGTATDGDLFFQFGSLVGWSATGSPTIAVKPAAFNGKEGWAETGKIWQGTTGVVPFTATGSDNEKAGIGDPCRYYLKDTWRLPTKDEYEALFKDGGYPSGTWKWENASATNSTKNLTFAASGYRSSYGGSLYNVGTTGYFWSASPNDASNGYYLYFNSSIVNPSLNSPRALGLPVRCVK